MLTNAENEDRHIKRLVAAVRDLLTRHPEIPDLQELKRAFAPFRKKGE
jgi:quinol monooxygenase YgiN